ESLTLNQLNEFLMKYHKNKNKNNYDSLIFVWCGYINTISEKGDILITSDDNRYKPFNKIQELFSFLNKPKIYIKNVYQINGYNNQQYHNYGLDTFIISSTINEKLKSNKESYFAECFCNVMSQNIKLLKSLKSLNDNIILVKQKILDKQIIQITTTCNKHIFLYITEIDKNNSWNKANEQAHKMVNEMINNKQQGIVVVATNIEQLIKSNDKLYQQQNIPFSMMINSNEYMKKKLIIGPYSVSSFYSKNITFDNIIIDGSVYVVDCIIDGFGNCHITQQLITTNQSIIRYQNLMELGENALDISKVNEAILLFRFALCVRLQTLHDFHVDVAYSYFYLSKAYRNKAEYDKAIEYCEKCLKILLNKLGPDHPD
ncbi:hypothetical protein RFI_27447, partial [Reticulomyxa filosa]